MKNYFKKGLEKQIEIKKILGWKKYLIALLICGYLAFIFGRISVILLPNEIIFLIISQIIMTMFFLLFINKHLYNFVKNKGYGKIYKGDSFN